MMRMFILKTALICGCIVIILFILYFTVPIYSNNYLLAYQAKCKRLDSIQSPRIIFVGGSNLAFGLDSKRIEDSLKMKVINCGLHAGIGMKYMIDDIALYAKKGDIIVFAPEWIQFYSVMYGDGNTLSTIIRIGGWEKWKLLNITQLKNVIKGIPYTISENVTLNISHNDTYLASNFNQYGDEIKHWEFKNTYSSHPAPILHDFNKEFGTYFINSLKKLQGRCKVYIIPPACCKKAYDLWKPQVNEVVHFLENEKFPFIIHPDCLAFKEEYCYDTDYHLNKAGVDLRTTLVIDALRLNKIEYDSAK